MWHVWETGYVHIGFWWGNTREGCFDSTKYKKIGETKRNLNKKRRSWN